MFGDWAAEESLFERIAARQGRAFVLSGKGTPEQVRGALVTAGYFDVFGVQPTSGRGFTDEDAAAGNAVIVTRRFAQRHFAGEAAAGRALSLDGEADEDWRVVGVAGDVKIESLADPEDSRAEV